MANPFDTLPDELVLQIFLKCIPHNRWSITPNPSKPPTSLTLVCKRWRFIALTSPSLWSWIRLLVSQENWRDPKAEHRISSQCRDVLQRSKPGPLSLMLCTKHLCLESVATSSFLANLISPTSHSLTRLILHKVPLSQVRSIPQGLFPALQSLLYTMAGAGSWIMEVVSGSGRPIMAFADAPSLRRVALDTVFFGAGKVAFVLPWDQITHFRSFESLQPLSVLFTRCLVAQSRSLQWLALDVRDHDLGFYPMEWERVFGPSKLVMEGVTTLSLGFEWGLEAGGLAYPDAFEHIEFPNLRTLRLAGLRLPEPGGSSRLEDYERKFLAKLSTFAKLELLSVDIESEASIETLEPLFESVPTARVLDFSTEASYKPVLQLLESNQNLLPHLDTLVLGVGVTGTKSRSHLCSLLDPRSTGAHRTSRIRRVVVWGTKPTDSGDSLEFERVVQKFIIDEDSEVVFDLCVGEEGDGGAARWMEVDPGSHGWEEVGVAEHLMGLLQSGDFSSEEGEGLNDTDGWE